MRFHIRRLAAALCLVLLSIGLVCCKNKNTASNNLADEIVVGEIGALTGSEATFGISTHQGIELAFEQINANGGVLGKKFRLITVDDQGKADEATTAVTKLITQDRVVAILGEVTSSRSLAMAPIAQSYRVPMISPSSTNPKVTEQGDFIFRVCFIDPFQGLVMARFALNNLGLKRIAVLRDVKSDYSVGLAEYFVREFTAGGGEIVLNQSYSNGDSDFKAQLTTIAIKKPQALFVPGYYGDVGLIARQRNEVGMQVPLLGGDGWDSPKLIEIGGSALDGSYFSTHYSPEDSSPLVQEFIKSFKDRYGVVADGLAAMGYDAALVLADAIKRAGGTESDPLRNAIAGTTNFPGVTGSITIDEHRNANKPAVVLKIVNGAYKYETTIAP